jgi:hypothetical protein
MLLFSCEGPEKQGLGSDTITALCDYYINLELLPRRFPNLSVCMAMKQFVMRRMNVVTEVFQEGCKPKRKTLAQTCPTEASCRLIWGYLDSSIKRNYIMQWNLSVERQVTANTTLTFGYAGSHGLHSPFEDDSANMVLPANFPNPIPGVGYYWPIPYTLGPGGAGQSALLNPHVGSIRSVIWESKSYYDGLEIRIDKRLSHGFQVLGSFTWSKSIDDSSGSGAGDTFLNSYSTPPWYDLRLDKGPSDFNIPRVLVINGLWNVPAPHVAGAFGERALGGWQFGGILTLTDGTPLTPVNGLEEPDLLGEEISTVNPPELLGGTGCSSLVNPGNLNGNIKAQCLGLVPETTANAPYCDAKRGIADGQPGTCPNIRGDLGRNVIKGPGLYNVDFSTVKINYFPPGCRKLSTFSFVLSFSTFSIAPTLRRRESTLSPAEILSSSAMWNSRFPDSAG